MFGLVVYLLCIRIEFYEICLNWCYGLLSFRWLNKILLIKLSKVGNNLVVMFFNKFVNYISLSFLVYVIFR